MRIVVHEYVGHPFAFQLSDELAQRGHEVLHLYSAQFPSPKALPGRSVGTAAVEALSLGGTFRKYSYFGRRAHDIAHGKLVARRIRELKPELVISSTTPLDAQRYILPAAQQVGAKFVYWLQDLYSIGITERLRGRFLGGGALLGMGYRWLERNLLRRSDAVIVICPAFARVCTEWGISNERCHIIENWAPLAELAPRREPGAWARDHGFDGKRIVLYAGTIGLKHDATLLLRLAEHLSARLDTIVVVVSEGLGADQLKAALAARPMVNLMVLPFQRYDLVGDMLSAATVAVATLNEAAGGFSVPSKITSYLSAGRAVVISAPPENQATRTILDAEAGLAVAPGDDKTLAEAVEQLLGDAALRERCGQNGRRFAEIAYNIGRIVDRFETAFAA